MADALIKPFDTEGSIRRTVRQERMPGKGRITYKGKKYSWSSRMDRVGVIRAGVPYGILEVIGEKLEWPIKDVLALVAIPQTTYNKKKKENALLDSRDSELVLLIAELIDYGMEVFNKEEAKFQRWLKKPNLALSGNTPKSMLDTLSGIQEVKFCLNRLEFGNFA